MASFTVVTSGRHSYPSVKDATRVRYVEISWNVALGAGAHSLEDLFSGDVVLQVWNVMITNVDGTTGVSLGVTGDATALLGAHQASSEAAPMHRVTADDSIVLTIPSDATVGAGTIYALVARGG